VAHKPEQVRNVALTGHSGSGKTSLAEAILFRTGKISRLGGVLEGTTVCDHDPEEIERQISIRTAMITTEQDAHHFNILDTPGYADFLPDAQAALRVSDSALVVIGAVSGVEVGTERVWRLAQDHLLPCLIVINKTDRADIDLDDLLGQIQSRFGRQAVLLQYPLNHGVGFNQVIDPVLMKLVTFDSEGAQQGDLPAEHENQARRLREQIVEAVAETDEALMEQYFGDGDLGPEQLRVGLANAVLQRELFPILFTDAHNALGVDTLLSVLASYFPSPLDSTGLNGPDGERLDANAAAPLAAFSFKTVTEQHVGDLNLVRLYSGSIKSGDEVTNVTRGSSERIGQIFELTGHERSEVESASAGDIVALVKLKDTHSGDTLCAKGQRLALPKVELPEPLIRVAITPREKGSEERMVTALAALRKEDPSLLFRYDGEIHQSVLAAQGDLHMESILRRLRERFGVEVDTETPRIPYRETIAGKAEGHHRHKKQSGGRGQFGEVFLRIQPKPRGDGFELINNVVGGSIPTNFIPAVEKGIQDALVEGPLCGSQVVDLAVAIYDGKHHPVDSDEVSFRIASSHAFKDAFLKAKPVLLEPICSLIITVPEEFMGDVMGDLTGRRGRIHGTDADGHFQIITVEVPFSEIDRYATVLRSITHGKGMYTQKVDRYELVPHDIQSKVVEAAGKQTEAS
jgi:elongation factor G